MISATYVDPAALLAAARFVAAYKKRFGVRAVERFALEAYDALLFVAQGLRELGNVEVERGAMVRRLRESTYKGLAKTIAFDAATDAFHSVNGLFLYRLHNGTPASSAATTSSRGPDPGPLANGCFWLSWPLQLHSFRRGHRVSQSAESVPLAISICPVIITT
ncbi:ABC transporter substrate-binding protein [Streptomyces sp. NPDC097610]|uniref:ABC transporter substrate-binding protein n=1 Tax=Streptomyces sp. NPDC097610 TaxID=3157227 RepID=UPI003325B246